MSAMRRITCRLANRTMCHDPLRLSIAVRYTGRGHGNARGATDPSARHSTSLRHAGVRAAIRAHRSRGRRSLPRSCPASPDRLCVRACAGAAQPAMAARDGPQALRELCDRRGYGRREGDGRVRSSPAATAQTGRQGAEPAAAPACAEPSAADGRCAVARSARRQAAWRRACCACTTCRGPLAVACA